MPGTFHEPHRVDDNVGEPGGAQQSACRSGTYRQWVACCRPAIGSDHKDMAARADDPRQLIGCRGEWDVKSGDDDVIHRGAGQRQAPVAVVTDGLSQVRIGLVLWSQHRNGMDCQHPRSVDDLGWGPTTASRSPVRSGTAKTNKRPSDLRKVLA